MDLNLAEMLSGAPVQLRYVARYSVFNVLHRESVAEHSFFTALYCLFIGEWAMEQGTFIDMGKLLTRAVFHDMEESKTGDLLRMFKHRDKSLAKAIEKVGEAELRDVVATVILGDSEAVGQRLVSEWKWSKDKTPEGRIMAFADFLSVLSYLTQELQFANESRVSRTEEFRKYVSTFNDPSFDFLRPLIDQARTIIVDQFGVD